MVLVSNVAAGLCWLRISVPSWAALHCAVHWYVTSTLLCCAALLRTALYFLHHALLGDVLSGTALPCHLLTVLNVLSSEALMSQHQYAVSLNCA